ncbi:MAG: hypothetical protein ABEJ60_00515 [Halodesulfurarchaeum sp.]
MEDTRRGVLGLLGSGATIALAGCLAPGSDRSVTNVESTALSVRSRRPRWRDGDDVGFLAVLDDPKRAEIARSQFALSAERAETVEAFIAATDFETERLLLVESVGPSACYREIEFSSIHLDGETLRGTAAAVARNGDACAMVITYPAVLLRVTFAGPPVDRAALRIRNGWDRDALVVGSTTTDLSEFAPVN